MISYVRMNVKLKRLVSKCVDVEHTMAELYQAFMERFPEDAMFWEDLHEEEMKHIAFLVNADIFDALGDDIGQLPLPAEAYVERTLASARTALEQFRKRAVPLDEALSMALKLEESVVEAFVSEAMESENNESPFATLLSDTRTHADKLRNLMRRKGFIRVS